MVPPLNLDRGESCCNFNSISSVDSFAESVTNSTTSSQNIKVLKKISLSKPRKTFKSSTSLSLTSEVTGEVKYFKITFYLENKLLICQYLNCADNKNFFIVGAWMETASIIWKVSKPKEYS